MNSAHSKLSTNQADHWRDRLAADASGYSRPTWCCLMVGLAINILVTFSCAWGLWFLSLVHLREKPFVHGGAVGVGVCLLMLLIAAATKPESRTDTANSVLDESLRVHSNADPATHIGVAILMYFALYGSYAIVEAIHRFRLQYRLRRVNRSLAAEMMARISASPVGMSVASLLGKDELRSARSQALALLIRDAWVEPVEQATKIVQRGQAMRQLLRPHPLMELFVSPV